MSSYELISAIPYAILGLGALGVLLLGVLPGKNNQQLPYMGSIVVLLATMLSVASLFGHSANIENFVVIDHFTLVAFELFAAGGLATILLAKNYPSLNKHVAEEFYALILIAVLGTFILASASNLLAAFLGMETIAIPMFALIAWNPQRKGAIEGGLKYAVTATVAAAFFMFGIALIYFGAGTIVISEIPKALTSANAMPMVALIGFMMLFVGICFELALAPFHSWLADTLQASPAPVMAFIGSIAKIAMLTFVIHFVIQIEPIWDQISFVLWGFVLFSIVFGNLLAFRQTNIKRILAYSSVAHFGYALMALTSVIPNSSASLSEAVHATAYYGLSYAVMNLVAFAVIAMLNKHNPTGELKGYRGLGRRYPLAGVAMAIAVLSLAGVPPTAGFFAKFFLFSSVLGNGYLGMVVLAALASAVSVFYYLRILLAFFAKEEYHHHNQSADVESVEFGSTAVISVGAFATIALGIFAQAVLTYMF
ncbi:NADH-quinone oxidoreductase subunit N [Photobacterium angustum]|uniref:NADH-quinone oxidoreductase subunit N n=1 Tax=Photobacterium angustum TaxID=661 RepID=UPI0005E91B7D|nr:NADH-quinone oxidoreductase subunit N [Photobacterium angustum]KJF92750.1 oxidoreductase [Photobacterium angustum]PSW83136.1 NADH-quinone oxidoreductase subunit N [Photobacterium angustum]